MSALGSVFNQLISDAASVVNLAEVLGFTGLGLAYWRFTIKLTEKIEGVRGNVRALDASMKSGTPSVVQCAKQMRKLEGVIRAENRILRDEVLGLTVDAETKVLSIDKRVRILEQWQARHNGREGGVE